MAFKNMKRDRTKQSQRHSRQARVRARVTGTPARPRLCVFKSATGLFVQVIDDTTGKTLASGHSKKTVKVEAGDLKGKVAVAFTLGKEVGEKAKSLGIAAVVFDRAGFRYHGRVKAVADGARSVGLIF